MDDYFEDRSWEQTSVLNILKQSDIDQFWDTELEQGAKSEAKEGNPS